MEVVATAGHVDHGKSALVRALTGREPDRLAEERRRGLTIDLGYAWTELEANGRRVAVAFVDVPGHDRFLTNMLAGVGPVQDVLFVVAADDGWSAQSEEHLEIIHLLGTRIVAVAVTKSVPAGPTRTAEVVADVRERLTAADAADTPVLVVDALEHTGIDGLRAALAEALLWPDVTGRAAEPAVRDEQAATLHEGQPPAVRDRRAAAVRDERAATLHDGQAPALRSEHTTDHFPRLWADRVFTVAGAGTVVTGTLVSGWLRRGDRVAVLPHGARGRVRELQCLELPVAAAVGPARVAVALAGIDAEQVERGDVLVGTEPDGRPQGFATSMLDAWLTALPHAALGQRGAWQLHLGSARSDARVLPLLGDLRPGEQGPARIEVEGALPVRVGDRFVLREVGRRITAGGGTVLDIASPDRRRGATARLEHAEALEALHGAVTPHERARCLVAVRGGTADIDQLEALMGRPLGSLFPDDPVLTALEGKLVERDRLAEWVAVAARTAGAGPVGPAVVPIISRDQVHSALAAAGCPGPLAPAVLRAAISRGEVVDVGGRVVHRTYQEAYLADRAGRFERLMDALAGPGLAFVDVDQIEQDYHVASFELRSLLDAGTLLQHSGVVFTPEAVTAALEGLAADPRTRGTPFTASDARQVWGLARKHTVPLLEHLRAGGHTVFDGTHHRSFGR